MPVSKSTKKFEKNKLKDVLKHRKEHAKVKQRQQINAKKKERKARDNEKADPLDGETTAKPKTKDAQDNSIGDMSMDQFFQGGFQVPELTKKTKPKTGKRKRTPIEEGSPDEDASAAVPATDDLASESESGDDADAHKEQLAELAEKDPEFYKYLKENDAELLEFAEDADLAEIDALSASEDEETPRKKQKSSKTKEDSDEEDDKEVTQKLVAKWKNSMEKNSSLRAMKEVVLAFRSAAHINDDSGKQYKYSIADPDGMSKPIRWNVASTDLHQCIMSCSSLPLSLYRRFSNIICQ
jgi:nucleolar complex protein 2